MINIDGITVQGDLIINVYNDSEDSENIKVDKSVAKLRTSSAMINWKKKIKGSEGICQCCGDDGGGHLEVHHIFPLAKYKDLATDEGNGISLCQKCHRKYHEMYKGNENAVTFAKFLRDYANRRYGV